MRYAVIDIGANTVRLQVYDVRNKLPVTLFSKKMVAGLVTYVENEQLSDKGKKKLLMVLSAHLRSVKLFNVKDTFVFATASLRSISNLKEVKKVVKNECGIDLNVLSQEAEAKLGYLGVQLSCDEDEGFTVDIGGGSIEIVHFKKKLASVFLNLDFGALSLYKNYVDFLIPSDIEAENIDNFVKKSIQVKKATTTKKIFGIGGTIRSIGNILSEFLPNNSNLKFSYKDVDLLYNGLVSHDRKLFKVLLQVSPERVHTIIPGTIIVKNILEKFNASEVSVCNTGLREGVLVNNLNK